MKILSFILAFVSAFSLAAAPLPLPTPTPGLSQGAQALNYRMLTRGEVLKEVEIYGNNYTFRMLGVTLALYNEQGHVVSFFQGKRYGLMVCAFGEDRFTGLKLLRQYATYVDERSYTITAYAYDPHDPPYADPSVVPLQLRTGKMAIVRDSRGRLICAVAEVQELLMPSPLGSI